MKNPASVPVALIGGGNMTRALVGGMLGQGMAPTLISVSDPNADARTALARDFGVTTTADNAAAVSNASVVVLSVKPQIIGTVARALAPTLRATRPLLISVAAGVRTANIESWVGADLSVVRAMPNRPALVGLGATALYAGAAVGAAERALAGDLLGTTGIVVWVPQENDLDLVTALSGSGPAYFFRLAQLMAEAGTAMGLSPTVAQQLAAQTLAGAGRLVATEPAPDLARMSAEVASKGGTTEAALNCFTARGLEPLVAAAMQVAAERSREIADQFGNV